MLRKSPGMLPVPRPGMRRQAIDRSRQCNIEIMKIWGSGKRGMRQDTAFFLSFVVLRLDKYHLLC